MGTSFGNDGYKGSKIRLNARVLVYCTKLHLKKLLSFPKVHLATNNIYNETPQI